MWRKLTVPEIFISYSRRDKVFVERFLKGLNDSGYLADKIWVDWEDIPASSDWEKEIHKGIEQSNSIIFILSPEWAASAECAKELRFAAEFNKRLFPIVWQNVDPKKIQPELASLNWIFFRETDNFDEAMQKLLAAINTDLGWVSQHTNLLSRANEWDTKKRDDGYLLHGGELQEAEAWLSQASESKQPQPTQLQREYIFTSRQDDVKRQRQRLVWVTTGLVISVILAIVAVISGLEALRQSQRALASQLAAQSTSLVSTQPDLSTLLSLESNFIGDELNEKDASWLGSLITSLNSSPKLVTYLRGHDSDVRAVAFSPDGHWLLSAGNPSGEVGQVILWDMTSTALEKPLQKFTGGKQRFLGVAFNPDGTRFAAAGDDKSIFVWDPQKCCEPIASWSVNDKVRGLVYAQVQGKEYIAVATSNQITFWDATTGQANTNLTLKIPATDSNVRFLSLAVSPKTNALAAGSDDGNVSVWDLNTGSLKFTACSYADSNSNDPTVCNASGQGSTDIRGVTFNANGSQLISGSSDRRAWLWDAETGSLLARSPDTVEGGHINTVAGVAINPVNGQVATVSWDNTVRLWNLQHEGQTWSFNRIATLAGHANSVWAAAYSPDGKLLATGSSDKTVILWKPEQINQIGTPFAYMTRDVWALAASSNGKQLAAGDDAGNIRVWNYDGHILSEALKLKQDQSVLAVAFSHNNKWLASAGVDQTIHVWDTATGKELWQIPNAHTDQIWGLAFNPDDTWLASASYDTTAKIWDTNTHQQVGMTLPHKDPDQKDDRVFALAFNDDGTQLLVAGYASTIFLWDVSKPAAFQSLSPLTGHSAAVNSLSFNNVFPPLLATTSDDKSLLIWNVFTHEHTPPVLGLNESMEAVTFRPSGDWLASATDNKTVLLWQLDAKRCSENWEANTCQPVRLGTPLVGHKTPVENVVFLSDQTMVSSSADGQLIVWNLDKKYWYQHACNIVNRSFYDSEYSQYIEGKVNTALLETVNWFSDLFGSAGPDTVPPCLQ
jgi:WD40 repeat protein